LTETGRLLASYRLSLGAITFIPRSYL